MSDEREKKALTGEGFEEPASGDFEQIPRDPSGRTAAITSAPSVPDQPLYRADPDRILRVLAAHQFEDPFMAFRELYANALDAVRGRSEPEVGIRAH